MYPCSGWWTWQQTTRGQCHTNYGWLQRRRAQNRQRVSSLNFEWTLNLVSASTVCLCNSVISVAKMIDSSLKTKLNHTSFWGSALLQNGFVLTFDPVVILCVCQHLNFSINVQKFNSSTEAVTWVKACGLTCVITRTFVPNDLFVS